MRRAHSIATLGAVEVGDHVCWPAPPEDFDAAAGAFIAAAARSDDKVLILGPVGTLGALGTLDAPDALGALGTFGTPGTARPAAPGVTVLDPGTDAAGWDPEAIGPLVSQEARTAGGQGFRALRVLARMEYLWPGAAPAHGEVARHELELDAVVAGGSAIMVCSYRTDHFDPGLLRLAGGVHPQHLGTSRPVAPNFRMFSQGPDCWSVSGVVDFEGAEAFGVAVRELAARSPVLRLRCEDMELMDAAGMRALASAAGGAPGCRVVIGGAGATVRRAWELLGLEQACPQVEMEP